MSLINHSVHRDQPQVSFLTSRAEFALLVFVAIAGALLFTEHRAHVLGASLWLVLLACPLLHLKNATPLPSSATPIGSTWPKCPRSSRGWPASLAGEPQAGAVN
jgi:hypothetical protein